MNRSGFALLDLLVASALAAVVAGLLLPTIQKLRAADARAKCADHLRQIGVASAKFADANNGILPRDQIGNTARWGWNVEVLPHLGQEKLAHAFNASNDWWAGDNRKVASTRVPLFQCPATPRPDRMVLTDDPDGGKAFAAAPTDYVGSAGAYYLNNNQSNLHPGAMHHRKITQRIRLADILDGATHTLLVVEMADKPNRWEAGKLGEDRSAKAQMPALNGQWAAPNWNHLRSYSTDGKEQFGPCAVNCCNNAAIYSFHDGGANCLFVDGSVRFLKAGMSQEMLIALVSIDGGEILADNDF